MASTHTDNEFFIVDEKILSEICWEEYAKHGREFDYNHLLRVVTFIKSGQARSVRRSYSEAVTFALEALRIPKEQWTVIRAKVSAYFKALKDPGPLDDRYWEVSVLSDSREIFLYHRASLSRSESLYHRRGFELGSVIVEGRPCRQKTLIDLHRSKCFETTYRILSGR